MATNNDDVEYLADWSLDVDEQLPFGGDHVLDYESVDMHLLDSTASPGRTCEGASVNEDFETADDDLAMEDGPTSPRPMESAALSSKERTSDSAQANHVRPTEEPADPSSKEVAPTHPAPTPVFTETLTPVAMPFVFSDPTPLYTQNDLIERDIEPSVFAEFDPLTETFQALSVSTSTAVPITVAQEESVGVAPTSLPESQPLSTSKDQGKRKRNGTKEKV